MQQRMLIELLSFYMPPKLQAVGVGYSTNDTFAERLERAIRASSAKLIEAKVRKHEGRLMKCHLQHNTFCFKSIF